MAKIDFKKLKTILRKRIIHLTTYSENRKIENEEGGIEEKANQRSLRSKKVFFIIQEAKSAITSNLQLYI